MELKNRSNPVLNHVFFFLAVFSFSVLFCPANLSLLFALFLASSTISILLFFRNKRLLSSFCLHKGFYKWDFLITITLLQMFYLRWMPSRKIAFIAGKVHLSQSAFLLLAEIFLGFFSCHLVDYLIFGLFNYLKHKINFEKVFTILLVLCEEYFILQFSTISCTRMADLRWQHILVFTSNICLIAAVNLLLYFIFASWKPVLCITAFLFGAWGIANYYTIVFHGSPLYLSEFVNAGTALAVINNYRFQPSVTTVIILCIVIVSVITTVDFIKDKVFEFTWKHFCLTALCILAALFVSSGLYSFSTYQLAGFMPWYLTVSKSGFLICNVKNLKDRADPVIMPEGYSNDILAGLVNLQEGSEQSSDKAVLNESPDIILILNESFCDLNVCCPINSDVDVMSAFYDIDGAVYGHAVIPEIGGGTNNSEFELLTSKSMYLLNSPAPFTYLNSELLSRSIVQYLNLLGYETSALHCEPAQNYSRNIAYPALGFNNILLGPENFSFFSRNGNRPWLDSDNYKDLIEYCKSKESVPQFLYLLTFQNHGGYQQNPPELDTVHSALSLGGVSEEIDEYLSSMKLSAESFRELTDYFENSQRHTIICMVGDHAPSFVTRLPEGNNIIDNQSINMRSVPYVIWSNFSTEASFYSEYASLTDLVPMILKTAGLPLSRFYSYILQLHETYPVRTSDGLYVNRSFETKTYNPASPDDLLNMYYYMEYNSLLPEDHYYESLFNTK